MRGRPAATRITTLMAVGFLFLGLAWILALPAFTGSDEFDHAFRASSVADGHWSLEAAEQVPSSKARGDLIPVRADVAAAGGPACARLPYTGPYNCRPARDPAGKEVIIASAAARYNPLYYGFVGTVAKPFHGNAALYVMRFAGLLVCVGLFALAVRSLLLVTEARWTVASLVAGALPTTVYSAAVAAPNGIEMAAGLSFWTCLAALVFAEEKPRWLYPALGVSAVLLVNMHTLGCFWLGLAVITVAVLSGVRRLAAVLRPRDALTWVTLLSTAGLIVFEVGWVMAARTNDPSSAPSVLKDSVWGQLPREMALWPLQAIAAYPLRDQPAPAIVYALAIALLLSLIVLVVRSMRSQPRLRRSVLVLIAVSYVVPVAMTAATYSRFGMTWQGRYGMPYSVGFFVLAAIALGRVSPVRRVLPGVISTSIAVWVSAQTIGLVSASLDQRDDHAFVLKAGWVPPSVPFLVTLCVAAALCWVYAAFVAAPERLSVTSRRADRAEAAMS